MLFDQYGQYVTIAIALYCIVCGAKTLLTGRATNAEEMKIKNFSAKGQKKFRLVSAVSNLVAGILLTVTSVWRLLNPEMNATVFKLILLGAVIVLIGVYIVNWQSCKKEK